MVIQRSQQAAIKWLIIEGQSQMILSGYRLNSVHYRLLARRRHLTCESAGHDQLVDCLQSGNPPFA